MANKRFINQMRILAELNKNKYFNQAADALVPEVYAAIALAMNDVCDFGYDEINAVFAKSQQIWQDFEGKPEDMINLCEEKTGICMKKGGD